MSMTAVACWLGSSLAMALETKPKADAFIPTVVAKKVITPPIIDGELDEDIYPAVAVDQGGLVAGWRQVRSKKPTLAPFNRIAFVYYDDTSLYIGAQIYVYDIIDILADPNKVSFQNDGLEVHMNLPGDQYFQFGIDALGKISAGRIDGFADIHALRGEALMSDTYWTMEVVIPWNLLGIEPKEGLEMGFNLAANYSHQGSEAEAETPITWGPSFGVNFNQSKLKLGGPLRALELKK